MSNKQTTTTSVEALKKGDTIIEGVNKYVISKIGQGVKITPTAIDRNANLSGFLREHKFYLETNEGEQFTYNKGELIEKLENE